MLTIFLCNGDARRGEQNLEIEYLKIFLQNRGQHQERNIFKFFNKIFFGGSSSCHQIFQSKSQHRKYYLKTCIQKEKCGETKTNRYKVKWLYEVILTSPCVELDEDWVSMAPCETKSFLQNQSYFDIDAKIQIFHQCNHFHTNIWHIVFLFVYSLNERNHISFIIKFATSVLVDILFKSRCIYARSVPLLLMPI